MRNRMLTAIWIALRLYLLLCVAIYFLQSRMLYLGSATRADLPSSNFSIARDGLNLRGWRLNPGQPAALLYFGGNAESVQYQGQELAEWFPDQTIYLLPYRGYGASEGSPSEKALKADALAFYDSVKAEHGQIRLLARSLGTGVALHVAARRPVDRLALITPYDSLLNVARAHYPWLPIQLLMRDRFIATTDAAVVQAPTLLLIAGLDEIIPPARAEMLATHFPQPPQIQRLDTDHNTVEMDIRFALSLRRFFGPPPDQR